MYCKIVSEFVDKAKETKSIGVPFSKLEVQSIISVINEDLEALKKGKFLHSQVDSLLDIVYFICYSSIKKGVNLDKLLPITHNSNMGKIKNEVVKREDGKFLKPYKWRNPEKEIKHEIKRQLAVQL